MGDGPFGRLGASPLLGGLDFLQPCRMTQSSVGVLPGRVVAAVERLVEVEELMIWPHAER